MSETVKEIANVLKDALVTPVQEAFIYRARNPFFGTFIIAWICYNWNKVAYFLLSKDDVLKKIDYIRHKIPDNSVFFGTSIPHTHSIIYPFLWACIMSLTYPFLTYISIWIHKWITGHIEKINSIKEISRIKNQDELIKALHDNDSLKTVLQADSDLKVEEKKEKAARSRLNVELLKEKKSTLESEIESLTAQKQSAQSTLSSVSAELEDANKRVDEIYEKLELFAKKYGDIETLRKKHEEIGLQLHEKNNKLIEAEESINNLTNNKNEENIKNKNTIDDLYSENSMLKDELKKIKTNYQEANGKLEIFNTRERNSVRARSDKAYDFRRKVDGICINLATEISSQDSLAKELESLHNSMAKLQENHNEHLKSQIYSSSQRSLVIKQGMEAVRAEILKLKETP